MRALKAATKNRHTKRYPVSMLTQDGAPKSWLCNSIANPLYIFSTPDPPQKALLAYLMRPKIKVYGDEFSFLESDHELMEHWKLLYEMEALDDETEDMTKNTFSKPYPNPTHALAMAAKLIGKRPPPLNSRSNAPNDPFA